MEITTEGQRIVGCFWKAKGGLRPSRAIGQATTRPQTRTRQMAGDDIRGRAARLTLPACGRCHKTFNSILAPARSSLRRSCYSCCALRCHALAGPQYSKWAFAQEASCIHSPSLGPSTCDSLLRGVGGSPEQNAFAAVINWVISSSKARISRCDVESLIRGLATKNNAYVDRLETRVLRVVSFCICCAWRSDRPQATAARFLVNVRFYRRRLRHLTTPPFRDSKSWIRNATLATKILCFRT